MPRARRRAAAPEAAGGWRLPQRWQRVVWGAATAIFLVFVAVAIEHKISWYLAVDQLGYLLFARDLLDGKLFHEWAPAKVLATRMFYDLSASEEVVRLLPSPTDVLAQTYVWDHGLLYSRYAPGFPVILAGWTWLFGEHAAHFLNPLVFLLLLAVLIAIEWRLRRSLWCGTAVATLVLLCPTGVSLWALTPTRDLAGHLFAFVGLLVLAGRGRLTARRVLGAGLALGYAGSIRPDNVLYLLPATMFAAEPWWRRRKREGIGGLAAVAVLGVIVGLSPSLAYYWAATGNPFVPTQAMEVDEFLEARPLTTPPGETQERVGYPPVAWRGTTHSQVSGGGLKLAYFPTTFPGNWQKIRTAYGPILLGFAACGLVVASVLRPALALAVGTYLVVALLVYSCWARPYGRYLAGIWLLVPLLIVEGMAGALDFVRYLRRRGAADAGRGVAIGAAALLVLAYALAAPRADGTALLPLTRLLVFGTAAALAATVVWPARRVTTFAVPALGLALVVLACTRLSATLDSRAPFQSAQITRATNIVRRTLKQPAVVITTEEVGRPMENLEYYADVRSLYLTDLQRWGIPVHQAVFNLMVAQLEPYLFIPRSLPERDRILKALRSRYRVELVQEVPPQQSRDFFVSVPPGDGMPMELWHIL